MDVYIKVEECGDDFASPVTSTVVSPLDDLGPGFDPGSSTDFGMTLFDDKKTFFDPLAPMAEPVTSFHLKKEYPGYEPVVTNIRPAAVVTSAADDVSYVVTSVSSQYSPTSNTSHQSYPGMTILYDQKAVESSTSPTRKYMPQKSYSPTKSSDPNFTAADSNSGSTGKSFVPCKVCGDKASGYHYGVTSCEGCKGFFRRSIQKKIEYRCLRDEKCLVIRLNRNRCQFCRFKKCLDVGMSRDSVRYGRVPKRSRERMEEQQQRVVSSNQQQQLESEQLESSRELALYDLTLTVAQAHHANCDYTEMRTRGLVRKPAIFSLNDFQPGNSDSTPDSLEQQKIVMWQHFASALTPSIQRVVEFAKKVPGFYELTQDDQLLLIKKGFFEIWVVHAARLTGPSDTTITFCDGTYITRQQIELMFDDDKLLLIKKGFFEMWVVHAARLAGPSDTTTIIFYDKSYINRHRIELISDYEFVLALFNFVTSLNNMELNDTEVALFSAIVLLSSERPGIYDMKSIDKLQERVMEALKVQVSKNRPSEPNAFPLLMMKLPELRSLGAKHAEHLDWFRANWPRLRVPPLFAEIFDIPKIEPQGQQQ